MEVDIQPTEGQDGVEIRSQVVVTARTGAEMEALLACSTAALALYDMVKAIERERRDHRPAPGRQERRRVAGVFRREG